jgi:hypothetical protein
VDEDVASQYSQESAENTIVYYTPVKEQTYYAVSLENIIIGNS